MITVSSSLLIQWVWTDKFGTLEMLRQILLFLLIEIFYISLFFCIILIHEFGHIISYCVIFRHFPRISVKSLDITIYPRTKVTVKQDLIIGLSGIIAGLIPTLILWNPLFLLAYTIGCSWDIMNISVAIHSKDKKWFFRQDTRDIKITVQGREVLDFND